MYDAPHAPLAAPPAPGAQAAKVCGILSIPLGFLCFPVGIGLAIVALVQQAKANRLASESPDLYGRPSATGMVTALIGLALAPILVIIGIISAIAIPALLSQRARARDKAAMDTMIGRTGDLVAKYDALREAHTPDAQIPAGLEALLAKANATDQNPWTPGSPACRVHIEVVTGLDRDAMETEAKSEATDLGQAVWVLELPAPDPYSPGLTNPGFLAGAVRLQQPRGGENVAAKVVDLE